MAQYMTTVRKPRKNQAGTIITQTKNGKNAVYPVDKILAHNQNQVKKDSEGVSQKIGRAANTIKESIKGSNVEAIQNTKLDQNIKIPIQHKESTLQKISHKLQHMKQNFREKLQLSVPSSILDDKNYNTVESDIKNSLKAVNADLTSQLEKVYQGIINNCLKKSEDEPHKLQDCLNQHSNKLKPVYKKMEERTNMSSDALKKCFQSKRNAQDCLQEGIKFGKQSFQDTTKSLNSYLM